MHWTSAVIFMELKKIQYFDSMGGTDRSKLEGLLQYLKDEHKAKKGTELDVSEWKLVKCTMDTPRQRNGKFWGVLCMTCVSFDCHELTPIFFLHHYQHLPTIRI
jgi:sentrin-specific protease 1